MMFGSAGSGPGGFGTGTGSGQNAGTGSVFGSGGGFGQSSNTGTNTGFGTSSGGFGSSTPAFGSGTNTSSGFGSGGFGSGTPAFGSANKPPFSSGATGGGGGGGGGSGGGLFGTGTQNNAQSSFGFGSTNNASAAPAFGSGATGGGVFGQGKSTFGSGTSTGAGGGIFGSSSTATGAFGSTNQTSGSSIGFGGPSSTQLPMQGTATVQYQPFEEKESAAGGAASGATNRYQTISFMNPYQGFSLEELRLHDYSQGRRYANESGQSGAFGFGTGFGGTGATANGGFSSTSSTAAGGLFGSNTNNQQPGGFGGGSTFGANTSSGGLFGTKPATAGGGLFGSNATSSGTGSGLFGTGTATSAPSGFGTTSGAGFGSTPTGGGLFGSTQNQQNKSSAFGGFGSTSTGGGFGTQNSGGTGFGNTSASGSLFGSQQTQQQPTGFSAQPPAGAGFGSGFGTSSQQAPGGFGAAGNNQQNKPAFSGFGSNSGTASGGLFGNNQQQPQQSGGAFGNKPVFGAGATATPSTSGGLFGSNNQAQPASGGGLFGNSAATPATGGGLFGTQQSNTNTGGSGLFSTKPAGGLFGPTATPTQPQSSGLFGQSNSTAQSTASGSLFTSQPQQLNQSGNFSGSLFNNSQNQQQQPAAFSTSIMDSPFGGNSLLSQSQQNSPLGPIATPIGSTNKKAAMIPHHKIAPRQSALAPRLSYSRSGSPFQASSSGNTPLGAGGSLGRSFSANKLNLFDSDDSVLSPGAFTPGSSSRVASLKKLVIDKKIRDHDLFNGGSTDPAPKLIDNGTPKGSTKSILKKTVSFDMGSDTRGTEDPFSSTANTVRSAQGPEPSTEELGYLRSTPDRRRNRDTESPNSNALSLSTDDTTAGKELALVDGARDDKSPGTYWMVPNAARLGSMPKEQQKKVIGLTIGRRGYGQVRFDHPVDVTGLPVDFEDIPGTIVTFDQRVCTVYPEGLDKPPPGKGLNVPATITLEDCFPVTKNERGKIRDPEHPRYITHIRRLKGIKDTEFVDYLANEGIWIFKVAHFTTYGLVDSDDEETSCDVPAKDDQPLETPSFISADDLDSIDADISGMDTGSGLDDTFEYKRFGSSNIKHSANDPFPGSFQGSDDDEYMQERECAPYTGEGNDSLNQVPFLGGDSVASSDEEEPAEPASDGAVASDSLQVLDESILDEDAAGDVTITRLDMSNAITPRAVDDLSKVFPTASNWTEQLTHTISPVKGRHGSNPYAFVGNAASPLRKSTIEPLDYGLLDLHKDLYEGGGSNGKLKPVGSKVRKRSVAESSVSRPEGILSITKASLPVARNNPKLEPGNLDGEDQDRRTVRAAWTRERALIIPRHLDNPQQGPSLNSIGLSSRRIDFGLKAHDVPRPLEYQLHASEICVGKDGIPLAALNSQATISGFVNLTWTDSGADQYEQSVWKLASCLWDPLCGLPEFEHNSHTSAPYAQERRRKEFFSLFLEEQVGASKNLLEEPTTPEEAAFALLTVHRIERACAALLDGGDLRLATLLPQLGGDALVKQRLRSQLDQWRKKGVFSDISLPVRAIYELAAGETCYSEGVRGPPEDAALEFWFAEKFGLDWKQVLGLKLWYGLNDDEGIATAVEKYEQDIKTYPSKVPVPRPWYGEGPEGSINLLWGLLKIYSEKALNLDNILIPTNICPNNLDYRMTWQLRTILAKRGVRDFSGSTIKNKDDGTFEFSAGELANRITCKFAEGLEGAGSWEWAMFVGMHLEDPARRESVLRGILARHIDDLEEDPGKAAFLENSLHIPRKWVFEARALKARHASQHFLEVELLISAGIWNEAHKTVVEQVAPESVISSELSRLNKILSKLESSGIIVRNWGLGGQVYLDYIKLMEVVRSGAPTHGKKDADGKVTGRLLLSLKGVDRRYFLQSVAVREMAGVLASWILRNGEVHNAARVLGLPLSEDQCLKKTVKLSLEYYKMRLQAA